ncbi:hypothetical protein J437_LFUL007341 [Ladona fulva]|uniref:DDE-1 domain-containing protein n=1 Tax=Ladona fulva TaxID=123851 RepID=A0A8K0KFF4_LADFU|nr:hypothetical protein J437_LFUL007341 [Ladona fulva]
MDEAGMKLWLQNVWARQPGGLLRKPSLLVWDQFRVHRTETIKNKKCRISNALDGTEDDALFEEGDTSDDGNSRDDDFLIFDDDDNEKEFFGFERD